MRTILVFRNVLTKMALQALSLVIGLFIPQLIIHRYGSDMNGLVNSVRYFLSYMMLFEAGITAAAIAMLYKPVAERDAALVGSIYRQARRGLVSSGHLLVLATVLFAALYPLIVGGQTAPPLAAAMVLVLGAAGAIEMYLAYKYQVLLTATQLGYVYTNILIAGTLLNAVATIALIDLGASLLAVCSAAAVIALLRAALLAAYVRRKFPSLRGGAAERAAAGAGANKLARRRDAFTHQIADVAVFNAPIILATLFFDLKEVSVFAVYQMVVYGIVSLVTGLCDGILSGFGQLIAGREQLKLRSGFNSLEYVYLILIAWLYATAFILIIPFVRLYTDGVQDADYIRQHLGWLFIIVGILSNLRLLARTIVFSAARFRETRRAAVAEIVILFVAAPALVPLFGLEGILLGAICAGLYRCVALIRYVSRHILARPAAVTVRKLARNAALFAIAVAPFVGYDGLSAVRPSGWTDLLVRAAAAAAWSFLVIAGGNALLERRTAFDVADRLKMLLRSVRRA